MTTIFIITVLPTILIFLIFACSELNQDQENSNSRELRRFANNLMNPAPEPAIEELELVVEEIKQEIVKKAPEVKPLVTKKPVKPEIDEQKLEDYSDILKAIGFSSRDAKSLTKKLLIENKELTQEELLRKATQK